MSITGNLRTLEFAELLQWLAQGQKTGALVIKNGKAEKRVYFQGGKIISSQSNNPAEHLGTFMVREGLLDEETLARAVKLQESTQILLGKVLVTLGTISEEELNRILQRKTEESLFELFTWTEGDFNFLPDDLPKLPMVPIEIDVTNVVLEGAKRLDEARRDAEAAGSGSGDYSDEIENVLSAEIFQGIDLGDESEETSTAEPALVAADSESLVDPILEPDDETETPAPDPMESGAYYSGASKKSRVASVLAAAAAIAVIAIGITLYFIMRPDPAAGTADRASLESAVPDDGLTINDNLYQPLEGATNQGVLLEESAEEPDVQSEPTEPEVEAPEQTEEMQARYEAELETLKQQLRQAQLVASERDDAMDKIAQLEEQVAEAQAREAQPSTTPESPQNQFAVAQFGEPVDGSTLSAGGDEAPPLGSSLPATDADQEAGTDFATEMVESTPEPFFVEPLIAEPEPAPSELAEEPAEDPEASQVTQAVIKSPVLLSRPKPRYPAAAMRLGKEAVVSLRLLIDTNGKVVDVERLGKDPGMGFSKAAINAALATKWSAATADGEPIEMWAEMKIAFKP